MWCDVPQAHKCYDSFCNEWDFNKEIDPTVPEGTGDSEGDYDLEYSEPMLNISNTNTHFYDDLMVIAGDTIIESRCNTETLDQLLSFRYGFVLPDRDFSPPVPVECSVLPWDKVRSILGDMDSPLDEQYKHPVTLFLGCFLVPTQTFLTNFSSLWSIWDLHEKCPMYFNQQESNFRARFNIVKFSDGQRYRLHRSMASPNWDLVLD